MIRQIIQSRRSWLGYVAVVLLLHVIGIWGLISIARINPAFWGLGLLAYSFGLRHAFDVDHIAAIDNTVRKIVQQKKNPLGVGFYFSLGHSSVVFCMVLAVTFSVVWVQNHMPRLQHVGGLIGTFVSGAFLVLIGVLNLWILVSMFQVMRTMRHRHVLEEELENLLQSRGLITRIMKPLFRFISRSWHVYPLGFLFGLGFDTATEVGLLAISAGAVKSSVSIFGILSLPLLFAAGMSLMDTADGMFMTTAYRWAFSTPIRKIYYNLTVTSVSVIAALMIGTVELMQVIASKLNLKTSFFQWISSINFGDLGYMLVGLFVLAWLLSVAVWKLLNVEERWSA